jgi:hypothetical protein
MIAPEINIVEVEATYIKYPGAEQRSANVTCGGLKISEEKIH